MTLFKMIKQTEKEKIIKQMEKDELALRHTSLIFKKLKSKIC
jgi:hypothetical protein